MLNPVRQRRAKRALSRAAIIFILVTALLTTSGCTTLFGGLVKQNVNVPPLLGPLSNASTDELIATVNRLAVVRSIRGNIDIQFEDTSFAESGIAEKYRSADGTVILQRPGQVRLTIQLPFVGSDVAQMTSDGERFRVAVLKGDEKYKRFVRGTNNAVYPSLVVDDKQPTRGDKKKESERRAVSALSNLRPQHLTDALLVRPIEPKAESGIVYTQSEFYQEEAAPTDARTRANSNKSGRVVRGYYLLDEVATDREGGTSARLMRRFWFDRVGGIRLARLQTYDRSGALVTDVTYGELKGFGETGSVNLPSRVELERPQDHYKLRVTYQSPEAVVLDRQYDADIFVLENKWQLPEVDLDSRPNQSTTPQQ